MTITIVGKHDPDKTYAVIKKHFENIEVKPEPGEIKVIEPPQSGGKRVEVFFNARPLLMMGWKKPAAPHKADYVFDMLSSVLGGGRSSRLHKALVLDKKIATSVFAWNGAPGSRYDNMFIIYASPSEGVRPEDVEAEILLEIRKIRDEIKPEELEKVRNQMESSFIFMLDNNDGIAHQLSYYQTVSGNWRYIADYMKNISGITSQSIHSVIDRYINDENRTTAILRDSRSAK